MNLWRAGWSQFAMPGALFLLVTACGGSAPRCGATASDERSAQQTSERQSASEDAVREAVPELPSSEREALAGRIFFVAEKNETPRVEVVSPTGERAQLLSTTEASYPAAVSSDGSKLAVIVVQEQGSVHLERILVYSLETVPPALQWTSRPSAQVRNPDWAPEGDWLAFEADYDSFREIYRFDLGAREPKRLTNDEHGNFEPEISPDGRTIVFTSSRDGNAEIYKMAADGSDPVRLTSFHRDDTTPRWSPDGRTIAFVSNRDDVERIYLIDADGANFRRLTRRQSEAATEESWPLGQEPHERDHVWSPDGKTIAFATKVGAKGASLRVADATRPGAVTVLTDGRFNDRSPAFSPDGRHLVFVSTRHPGGDLDLYLTRADGSALSRLTDTADAEWLPRWIRTPR